MFRNAFIVLTFTSALLFSGTANAEYSVAYTFNDLFGAELTPKYRIAPPTDWTLKTMDTLQLMVMDTASTRDLYLKIHDGETFKIYDTPAWTSSTRGYGDNLIGTMGLIDLASTFGITQDDVFSLYVGDPDSKNSQIIDPVNARLFKAPDSSLGFLLGFNDNGGWKKGDGDMNEPLFYGKVSATPIPGAIWLLGTGIIGVLGLRRKFA